MVLSSALVFGLAATVALFTSSNAYPQYYNCDGENWKKGGTFGRMGISKFTDGASGGACSIEGVPAQYVPGNEYDISIASKDNLAHKLAISQGGGTITGENSQSTSCRYKSTVSKTSSYKWIAPQSGNAVAFFALCGRSQTKVMHVAEPKNSEGPPPTSAPTVPPTTSAPTAQHCDNRVQDSDESDIDCGGNDCRPCAVSQKCARNDDCETKLCIAGSCTATIAPTSSPTVTITASPTASLSFPRHVAHGVLMFIAFGLCFPIGAIFPMYLREWDNWFKYHRGAQIFAALLGTIGLIIIISAKDGNSKHFSNSHERLGLVIYIATVVQVIGGLLRPHKSDNRSVSSSRRKWSILHHAIGVSALILGLINCILGSDRLQSYDESAGKNIRIAAVICAVIFCLAILERVRRLALKSTGHYPSWADQVKVDRSSELVQKL